MHGPLLFVFAHVSELKELDNALSLSYIAVEFAARNSLTQDGDAM